MPLYEVHADLIRHDDSVCVEADSPEDAIERVRQAEDYWYGMNVYDELVVTGAVELEE